MPGFTKFRQGKQMDVNKANLWKKNKKVGPTNTHFTVANSILLKKATRNLKGAEISDKMSEFGLVRK